MSEKDDLFTGIVSFHPVVIFLGDGVLFARDPREVRLGVKYNLMCFRAVATRMKQCTSAHV